MKKILLAAALFASTLLIIPQKTSAQELSFGVFYSSLSPYGRWIENSAYGMCWRPIGVPNWWRPYTYGHWVWSDYGWTWVSNYPWGWATFHYGRWVFDPPYGWIWVPGYVWAPSWVEWRWGGGYAGWAPMPPGFHFRLDAVIGPSGDDFGVGIDGWTFMRADEFGSTHYRFVERPAVPRLFGHTRNVTRFRFTPRGVYNEGMSRNEVEKAARRRIGTVTISRSNEAGRERIVGNRFHIYSPAPLTPRVRNEQEIIQRERTTQRSYTRQGPTTSPERIRRERAPNRTRVEPNRPEMHPKGEVKTRQRQEVRPGKNDRGHKEEARPRPRDNKGPGKRR